MSVDWKNKLYFGDNLDILREHFAEESVDLIYLDPPFNSNATYNVLFKEHSGERSTAQITAFDDTWHWGKESQKTFHELVTHGPRKVADLVQALSQFLGPNDMLAYLTMMAIRLVELHRVLKPTGSIYLHCDPTASHYLKLVMDAVFGPQSFRNEIVWQRTSAHNDPKKYGRNYDCILYYGKSGNVTWNELRTPYDPDYIRSHYGQKNDRGHYTTRDMTAPDHGTPSPGLRYAWNGVWPPKGRTWTCTIDKMREYDTKGLLSYSADGMPRLKRYLDDMKGVPIQALWTDVPPVNSQAKERLGYPTQKPEALLERIIKASSNESDVVLDPFCGCGTAISVAERLRRRWIGIDITHLAITLIRHRLHNSFGSELSPYRVIGAPKDLASAEALATENRHQFEWWALGLVDARPAHDKKKGADTGIDGYAYFFDDNSGKAKQIIVQVKSGHVTASQIRDLKGVLDREKAQIGVFITLQEPTKPMLQEAITAGYYVPELYPDQQYPRLQILTIKELLEGKCVQYPRVAPVATFKRAERKRMVQEQQAQLL